MKLFKDPIIFVLFLILVSIIFVGNSKRITYFNLKNPDKLKSTILKEEFSIQKKLIQKNISAENLEYLKVHKDDGFWNLKVKSIIVGAFNHIQHDLRLFIVVYGDIKLTETIKQTKLFDEVVIKRKLFHFKDLKDCKYILEKQITEEDRELIYRFNFDILNDVFPEHLCKNAPSGLFSEYSALILILSFFTLMTFINPYNGISFLLILMPFLLGDSKRPFFVHIESLVYIILFSGLIHLFFNKEKLLKKNFPFLLLIFLFFVSSFLSFPLNLKEVWYFLKGSPFKDWISLFLSSNEGADIFYLRTLSNLITGIGLYFIVLLFAKDESDIYKTIRAVILTAFPVNIIAFCFKYDWIAPLRETFLTAQFLGQLGINASNTAMCGFAYNPGYWGQYLVCILPLSLIPLFRKDESILVKFVSVITFLLCIISIPLTYQRGPFIGLVFMALVFMVYLCSSYFRQKKNILWVLGTFIVLITGILLADAILTHGYLKDRMLNIFNNPGLRDKVWRVAVEMFSDNKLLGVGIGKFHYFFPKYCQMAGIPFEGHIKFVRTEAHNTFFHILAEQGLVGIISFLVLIGGIIIAAVKNMSKFQNMEKVILISFVLSFSGWLAFGFSQNMFYVRIMQLYFWIIAAMIGLYLRNFIVYKRLSSKIIIVFILVSGVLLIGRMETIVKYFAG